MPACIYERSHWVVHFYGVDNSPRRQSARSSVHYAGVKLVCLLVLLFTSAASWAIDTSTYPEWVLPDVAASPDNNPYDARKAELGKMLFFDPRLSGDGNMSCATCHDPSKGWSDGLPTGSGHQGKVLSRATPTILNVGFSRILMWDGRAASLEEQALGPIENPDEMHNTQENLLRTLNGIPGYVKAFKKAYWGLGISANTVRKSIAMYQRQVVANNSRFDRWVAGDTTALNKDEVEGFKIFTDTERGNCIVCHQPPNFTDDGFHNIGLESFAKSAPDLGRYNQVRAKFAQGSFKTQSLRNIAQTAPYFHDGSAKTLEDVVEHYAAGGRVSTNLSPNLRKLKLSKNDKRNLVAFLKTLTSDFDPGLTSYQLP